MTTNAKIRMTFGASIDPGFFMSDSDLASALAGRTFTEVFTTDGFMTCAEYLDPVTSECVFYSWWDVDGDAGSADFDYQNPDTWASTES